MSDKSKELALTTVPEPTLAVMIQGALQHNMTTESAAVIERLCALKEREDARNAEKAFTVAFNRLQSEMPVIVAQSVIPNRGKYERFEDVMNTVGPLLIKNGFAVSFEQFADDKRIKVTCHLRHIDGHCVSTPFAVRLGGKADSETQADCKASTTAKRNALLQALNIVVRQDYLQEEEDARLEGGPITQQQADELRDLCDETGSDRKKFLAFAGAEDFEQIASSRYEDLVSKLRSKLK